MKTTLHRSRMRGIPVFLAVAALLTALCLPVSAAGTTFEVPGADMTVTLPDGVLPLSQDTPADDPVWSVAGIVDTMEKKTELAKNEIAAELYAFDGSTVIAVSTKTSDYTESVFSINDLTEEDRAKFLEQLKPTSKDGKTDGTVEWYAHGQTPFFCIDLHSSALDTDGEVYERIYGTLYNGMTVSFDLYNGTKQVSEEQDALLRQIVDSAVVTDLREAPTLQNMPKETIWGLLVLCALIVLLVIFFIYRSAANRREKREKTELADRIALYRQQKAGNEDEGTGALCFVNETEHNDNAIRAYAQFHAYRKNIFMPIFTMCIGTVAFVVAWLSGGDNWWILLLLAACVVYCAYRLVTAGTTITRTQMRVFGKLRSRKAAYYFYEGDFRITGLQASNLHPYFQITSMHETKEYFYMYFGQDNTYYIKKDSFKQGDADSFRAFMKQKIGKKMK